MQIKSMCRDSIELLQPSLSKTPKALNAIDVAAARGKLIGAVIHPKMFKNV